jgi:hypothetical protein
VRWPGFTSVRSSNRIFLGPDKIVYDFSSTRALAEVDDDDGNHLSADAASDEHKEENPEHIVTLSETKELSKELDHEALQAIFKKAALWSLVGVFFTIIISFGT